MQAPLVLNRFTVLANGLILRYGLDQSCVLIQHLQGLSKRHLGGYIIVKKSSLLSEWCEHWPSSEDRSDPEAEHFRAAAHESIRSK